MVADLVEVDARQLLLQLVVVGELVVRRRADRSNEFPDELPRPRGRNGYYASSYRHTLRGQDMPRVYLSSVIDVARSSVTGVIRVIALRR
jgi:hypothetical protein